MRTALAQHFPALFPSTVVGVELSDPELIAPLFPEETATIARAVDKRKQEFALGRTAARKALKALGIPATSLPALPDRSVAWPPSVWGSITHADGICAAVAALRAHHAGVGIDAEVQQRVKRELWRHIATERETAWLESSRDEQQAAGRATLLFSAKEAFYKAQFCASRGWVGFQDAEITLDEAGSFEVQLLVDVGETFARGTRFEGKYVLLDSHVVTGLALGPHLPS
ncbi:MAG: 4-phosphopantetheinyl transferase [Myxococcaceae bacterium]|nr:4-phosphopantetheinyl transferase [Myxococcaceae bacterium]